MHLPPLRALIFDLDGTLIDSERDLINSCNATLRHLGRPELPAATVSSFIGHGAAKLVASAIGPVDDPQLHAEALQYFLHHYDDHKLQFTRPYPGVPEALARLAPLPMAVLTNKPQLMSAQILASLGLAKFFTYIYGGDSFPARKPDPAGVLRILQQFNVSPAHALFVGDSEVDVQTARNAGTFAAAVNHGFGIHDRDKHPADIYLDSLTDLLPLLHSSDPRS